MEDFHKSRIVGLKIRKYLYPFMIRGNHFYVTLISENRCNYRGFYRKSLLLPLAEGSVHTHTHTYLDAFYFIFREIPVN